MKATTAFRHLALWGCVLGAATLSSCQSGTPAGDGLRAAVAAPVSPAPRSRIDEPNTLHGVYTAEQAGRGRQVFAQICSECHDASDWTDPAFLGRWEEASVFRLWHWIYGRMPHGNPGSLTREQVTDALAYIFELNGLPPGAAELGTDDDSLDDYWIFWSDPRRGRLDPEPT